MSLSRLLLRSSIRRFSSNPYYSPFPTNHSPLNPEYPNPPPATNYHHPPPPAAANHHYPATNTQNQHYTNNYQYNPQPAPPPPNYNYTATNSPPPNQYQHYPDNYQYNSPISPPPAPNFQSSVSPPFVPQRPQAFSSAEEAAAERRRRKRRLRIEPPIHFLRSNPSPRADDNSSDKPRLPENTSSLVGERLSLHNKVQSLIRSGDLEAASYAARQAVFQRVRPTVFTCNAIIAAMYRAKRYSDAKALFQYFFRQFNIIPNVVSYNNLIVSHCESNEVDEALKVYQEILEEAPYSPSSVTYRHLTKGLVDTGRIGEAVSLLREMLNKSHGADSLVFNNVILGFLNLGELEKANELFDELKERCTVYDGVVNATFMDWFFKQGKDKEAMESYRDLMGRNYRMVPATRNVLLETLLKHGKKKEAWDLFHDMLDDHTPPTFQAVNSDTINMMVNMCFKEGKLEEAMDVFKRSGKAPRSKPFHMDVPGFNNMIIRLCELEMMEEAESYHKQLCDKSLAHDVNTYIPLIDTYIKVDMVDNMLAKFLQLVETGLRVITPHANRWFGYMIEKGKALECVPILSRFADREPKPDVTTYDVVIRGLVREGHYDAASNVLRDMMNFGIGTTASLKEFVLDVFEKQGRRMEVDNILNMPLNGLPPQRPVQGSRGTNPTMPWQRTSPQPTSPQPNSNLNWFPQKTHQPQMSVPPNIADQGRTQQVPWQTTYSPQQMQVQTGFSSQTSHANHFAEQTSQPHVTQDTHQTSEQETDFPQVAGRSAA